VVNVPNGAATPTVPLNPGVGELMVRLLFYQ